MIRSKEPQAQLFYASEELYRPPRTNFYARLNRAVGSWKELCRPLEGAFSSQRNGRPVDPAVYFKIFLVGYLEGIVFDTDLAERVADSLAVREFIGFGPTERTPDHASLSRVRAAFAQRDLLEAVLEKTVALCAKAGLVSGEETAVDSTLLPASASLSSLRCLKTGATVAEHMKRLKEAGEPVTARNDELRSSSDSDARIARKGQAHPRGMYYKATLVVDAKEQVILSSLVSRADVGDSAACRVPLTRAKASLESQGLALGRVVGDAGYDDTDLHAFVEELGSEPLTNYVDASGGKPQGFGKKDFVYDEARNVFRCPAGKNLKPSGGVYGGKRTYYAKEKDCRGCPFAKECLGKVTAKRRTVHRHVHERCRERNIARCHTEEGRAALKRRKTVAEPPFAHMKRLGGLHKLNCRGLGKADVKGKVAAIAWNLLKLASRLDPQKTLRALWRRWKAEVPLPPTRPRLVGV